MSKVLKKPYTLDERAVFINANQSVDNQRIELVSNKQGEELMVFALLPHEVLTGEYEETTVIIDDDRPKQIEKEFVANLPMTPLDFINFLEEQGLTLEQINEYLENNLRIKMQLTYCNNVYCGVVCKLLPITIDDIIITEEKVIQAFKTKNGVN